MENEIKLFKNDMFGELYILIVDGKEYFPATDVAKILGYADPHKAIKQHTKKDGWVNHPVIDSLGRNQEKKFINEGNLYRLIVKSKLPEAEKFEQWVFDEILPTIRNTGGYVSNDELFVNTYLPFADEQTKLLFSATLETVRKQNEQIAIMKPKVEQHDRFISAENLQTLEQVGKTLGIGRNKLSAFLKAVGVFTQKGGSPIPYQRFINEGYFKVKQTPSRYYEFNNVQTYVTARGVSYIDKLLIEHGGAEYINSLRLKDISRFPIKANLA